MARLTGKPALEVVRGIEDEADVVIEVEDGRTIGHRDEARRRRPGAVEMLMPGVERDREHGTGLPLETDPVAGIVPYARCPAAIEHKNHLLIKLALRRKLVAGRNFAHVAIVGDARCLVVDEHALAVAPPPRL